MFLAQAKFHSLKPFFLFSCRMLLKLQTSSIRSIMLLETREDKLSARGVAFEDALCGLQVSKEN